MPKSAKELRDELRALRKDSAKPVSRMRIADVASEIERLKGKREDTPLVAATPAHKEPKKMAAKIADAKEAKAAEFPVAPSPDAPKKKGKKEVVVGGSGAVGVTTEKSSSKKSKLEKLLSMLESDSE